MDILWIIAVACFVLTAVAVVLLYVFKKQTLNFSDAKRLAFIGVLTAVSALLNIVLDIPISQKVKWTFTAIPCFAAGVLLGPIEGFVVGFLGDLLGCIIAPQGVYIPVIGLASGLWGLVPGVIFTFFKGNEYVKAGISFLICFIVCTIFLNTFGLWLVYGMGKTTFIAYLLARLPFQAIVLAVNAVICIGLLPVIKTVKKRYIF